MSRARIGLPQNELKSDKREVTENHRARFTRNWVFLEAVLEGYAKIYRAGEVGKGKPIKRSFFR
jgi:hypothetical protein